MLKRRGFRLCGDECGTADGVMRIDGARPLELFFQARPRHEREGRAAHVDADAISHTSFLKAQLRRYAIPSHSDDSRGELGQLLFDAVLANEATLPIPLSPPMLYNC